MDLVAVAGECGFEDACMADPQVIRCRQEIRDICTNGLCPMPGTCWSCPPGCGSLEERRALIGSFHQGAVLQTIRRDFDSTDMEATSLVKTEHDERLLAMLGKLREAGESPLVLTAGGCGLCPSCSYPEPCLKPDERFEAISASGIDLDELCNEIGMEYSFRQGTLRFVSIILL